MADPTLKPLGDSLFVVWSAAKLTLAFSRLSEHRDTLTAEVVIVGELEGDIHWARVNLASTQARATLAKAATEAAPRPDWRPIIERSCQMVAAHLRAGEPAIALEPIEPVPDRWLVANLIPMQDTTILFADGGKGMSFVDPQGSLMNHFCAR